MALWFPIMVNDKSIGYVNIRRTQALDWDEEEYDYACSVELDNPRREAAFTVKHTYSAGAAVLISKVMDEFTRAVAR